jgi:hypothetical protein
VFAYNDFTYSGVASLPCIKPKAVNRLIGLINWLADFGDVGGTVFSVLLVGVCF